LLPSISIAAGDETRLTIFLFVLMILHKVINSVSGQFGDNFFGDNQFGDSRFGESHVGDKSIHVGDKEAPIWRQHW
jgi:hypothetical protein